MEIEKPEFNKSVVRKSQPAPIPSLEADSGKAFSKRIIFSSYASEVSESGNVKSRVLILTNHGILFAQLWRFYCF